MSSYAVLGATGNTGKSLIQILLKSPDKHIRAYCRSREKLIRQIPEVANHERVQIFSGALTDTALLADCIRGTRAVFLAVAINENEPGTTVARDTATAALAALDQLRAEQKDAHRTQTLPRLIVLSAAPLSPQFTGHTPAFILALLRRGCSHIYYDLAEAEKLLRAQGTAVSTTFVKPGALSPEPQAGYVLSTTEGRSPVSFLDLAAGMIEIADEDPARYDMADVSVNATTKVPFDSSTRVLLLRGLLFHYFPWLWRILK